MKTEKTFIKFRIAKFQKEKWKKLCFEKKETLTDLIISSVENKLMENEKREIMKFIESQDNIFIKIENNINQFAKVANGQKFISEKAMANFTLSLNTIIELKEQQNKTFEKIYSLLANDSKNT